MNSKTICGSDGDDCGDDDVDAGADSVLRFSYLPSFHRLRHSAAYTVPYCLGRCNIPIPRVPAIRTTINSSSQSDAWACDLSNRAGLNILIIREIAFLEMKMRRCTHIVIIARI